MRRLILFLGVIWVSFSCNKFTEDITTIKLKENDKAIKEYLAKNNINAIAASDGIYYIIDKKNDSGKKPEVGDLTDFHFLTQRLDGFRLDSTVSKENKVAYSPFGTVSNIWSTMSSVMREGESGRFFMPFEFAYGDTDLPNVPAYSPIIFTYTVVRYRNQDQQLDDYFTDRKLTATKTQSGLRYVITKPAISGDLVKNGQTLTVKYTGSFPYYLGAVDRTTNKATTVFDSGTFDVVLGTNRVVAGFEEGLSKLKPGERAIIGFPSALGYKDTPSGSIPGKSPLIFEIEITAVK